MHLVLFRHSTSLINPHIPITTWGLSEKGVELAKRLHELPEIKAINVMYSSLQTKALETAVLATKNSGIPIKTDNRLTETTAFTNTFVSIEQLQKNTREYYTNPRARINNGETSAEALLRFNTAIQEITNLEQQQKTIGIVSHGNILAAFCAQFCSNDPYEFVEKIKQPDIAVFNWDTKQFISFFGDRNI